MQQLQEAQLLQRYRAMRVKRPFKVTQSHPLLCQYDFLLELNSNLISIFDRS